MSNNKEPWDIIGWGVIIVFVIRALPLIFVWGLVFWLLGGFGVLVQVLGFILGLLAFIYITGDVIFTKMLGPNPTKEHRRWVMTGMLLLWAVVLGLALGSVWHVLGIVVVIACLLGLIIVWM